VSIAPGISPFARTYVRIRTADRMTDECQIYTPGPPVLDKATGKTTRGAGTVKYQGVCRVFEQQAGAIVYIGDQQVTTTVSYLTIPFDAPLPETDDVVVITKSDDPDLVGRTVSIQSMVRGGGLRASRRFQVLIVTSKKESW
jgi:hypothetical protein